MAVISANVDEDLIDWADRYHAALGYRSRSALITEAVRQLREENSDPENSTDLTSEEAEA